MKKIILKSVIALLLLVTYSCEENNSPIFTAQPDIDGIKITSSFVSNYIVSEATEDNIADRIIWESAEFDVQTNITYEVQGSIDPTFATFSVIGTTSETNYSILISDLLGFASQLGLDDDPNTTNTSGQPNNKGQIFIRIKANVGTANNLETFSDFETMNFTWLEKVTTNQCNGLWLVGDAVVDAGWNFVISTECDSDVHKIKLSLTTGVFRFFEIQGDWNSGLNFPYYVNKGYTIDSNFENDGSNDANFKFLGTPGIYELIVNDNDKTIVLNPSSSLWAVGAAVPGGWGFNADTVEFVENTPNIWSASITLSNDVFRLFQTFGTWDTNNNMTYYEDEGFTIDSNFENDGSGDGNFKFTGITGTYTMTINAVDKIITLN